MFDHLCLVFGWSNENDRNAPRKMSSLDSCLFSWLFLNEIPPKELKSADKQHGKCIFKTSLGHFSYKGNSTFGKIIVRGKIYQRNPILDSWAIRD